MYFITILHIIVIMFVLLTPFTNSNYLLFLHFTIVPFIVFHWIINDNTCCLTVAEKKIKEYTYGKNVEMDECLSYKLIAPIYDFTNNYKDFEMLSYLLVGVAWSMSGYKLYSKISNHQITNIHDLLKM